MPLFRASVAAAAVLFSTIASAVDAAAADPEQVSSVVSIPPNTIPLIPDEDSLDFEERMKLYRFLDSVGKLV
ncbi:hypothetical protein FB645_003173 [Coemansia sp. IMI 203386]|nr:hypothetical protein FB645_003173 [Coemansia sp. IMI 203386]